MAEMVRMAVHVNNADALQYNLRPLFPGDSEIEQWNCICSILGTPSAEEWPEGIKFLALAPQVLPLPREKPSHSSHPQSKGVPLATVITRASEAALHLLRNILQFRPENRPTAREALGYPFFRLLAF